MYFLERKENISRPNVLGNCSFPVHTYRWKQMAICEKREPLEKIVSSVPDKDQKNYRIISNNLEEA